MRLRATRTTDLQVRRWRPGYRSALLLILIIAAVLRFTGLDWDNGRYLHPDERFMVMVTDDTAWPDSISGYFDSATSPLNPYNTRHGTFVYGTFPLFLTKALGDMTGHDIYGNIHIVGRALSALSDTGTVFLAAWIGRRFWGDRAGLLAGFLIAFTMLHVQSAHFYTVDAMSVFFATATFVTVLKGWDRRSMPWFAVAGVMAGLAGASKPNYLIALGFLALPVLETVRLRGIDGLFPSSRRRVFPIIPAVVLAGLVAFWTFRIGQPYAFAGPHMWDVRLNPQWTADLRYWQAAQSGLIDIKAGIQWVGRTPILYIVQNLVAWGMGPPLGLAALAALAVGTWRVLRSPRWPSWWMLGMLGWSIAQILLYGTNMAQAQRYLLPIYPFLIALAAGLLVEVADRFRSYGVPGHAPGATRMWRHAGSVLIGITALYTAFYGIAFDTLYVRPLSRVQASAWIYDNVPPGSTLTSEYWDDALPITLEGEDPWAYNGMVLDLYGYEGPDNTKLSRIIGQLNAADYIVLSSNRIIKSVPRQPDRYPMATHYYEMLLNGDLGFELVAEFSQTPQLFGIRFDDTDAEETITVYEHPYVRIFRKTDAFDIRKIYAELDAAMGYGGVNYLPGDPVGDQMFLTDDELAEANARGTWSSIYHRAGWVQDAPALWWYIAMQVLAVPALPLAWALFRRFPDRGYAIAKILGLLLVTWVAWLFGSTRLMPFGPGAIVLAWALALGAGLLLARGRIREDIAAMRSGWRGIVATETLFLVAYVAMVWLRSHNAAFWTPGGTDERPLWFAIFTAAARSPFFPPYDAWLSGGQLHLPYWGMMPWVLLTRLTGIVPETAYTLAFAGIFALLVVGIWSLATAIIHRVTRAGFPAAPVALLAPLLAGFAGTLEVVARAGQGEWGFPARPDGWPVGGVAGDILYGIGNVLTRQPDLPATFVGDALGTATDARFLTPFAAIVAGDLSAVATTLPILVLVLAIAAAIVLEGGTRASRLPYGALLVVGGVTTGLMTASAVWGMTVAAPLIGVAVVIRLLVTRDRSRPWPLARDLVLHILALLAIARVAVLPFRAEYVLTERNAVTGDVLSMRRLVITVGALLLATAPYVLAGAARVLRESQEEGVAGRAAAAITLLLAGSGIVAALALDSGALLLLMSLLLVALAAWHWQEAPMHLFLLALLAVLIALLVVVPMMPMPTGPFGESPDRDTSGVSWTVAALIATGTIAWLADRLDRVRNRRWSIAGGMAAGLGIALLVGMVASPVMIARAVTDAAGSRSLDATAFLGTTADPQASAADRAAAQWLMDNVEGLPVLLEAPAWDHQYGGRISAMTGLPAVLGWPTPERFMRPGWEQIVTERQQATQRIYGSLATFDDVAPLLDQYGVRLVYVGPLERATYDAQALAKFERAAHAGELEIVYEEPGVTIYAYTPQGAGREEGHP